MKKEDVGGILFSIKRNSRLLCELRFGYDGELNRSGNGILPCGEVDLSGSCGNTRIFKDALKLIPEHIIKSELFGPANTPQYCTEYKLLFTHRSAVQNNEMQSGIRIVHLPQGTYSHPLMPVLLNIGEKLMAITDKLYLDAVLLSTLDIRTDDFPTGIEINGPKNYAAKQLELQNYLQELEKTGKFKSLTDYTSNKVYWDSAKRTYRVYFTLSPSPSVGIKPVSIQKTIAETINGHNSPYRVPQPQYIRGKKANHKGELPVHIIPKILWISMICIVVLSWILTSCM